ncbi:CHAD domain-containing protein [Xanthocytophaga agilis]|uniref:CHAD domain-containing protein n=1 Tax=Xanthocytophaga agilis TaxID=3048010 RepID=A0AAE3RAV3_9BACT|nr:CHAD domain-containing protein [Xanthocytophaga agilis]MDJ1506435.1 CHAD domain-containing protein [Xanthocytophaga agilis]
MSFTKSILTQWNKQHNSFEKSLAVVQKELSSRAVHQLRVSIKKLRAFIKLTELVTKEKEHSERLPSTSYLFRMLGKYRELDLQLAAVSDADCPVFKSHLQHLKMQTAHEIKAMLTHFQEKEITKLDTIIKTHLETKADKQALKKTKQYIREKDKNTQNQKEYFAKNTHLIRKRLKNIGYWLQVIPDQKILRQSTLKKLHQIVSMLGLAHDAQVLGIRIKHFRKDYLVKGNSEIKILQQLERKTKKHSKRYIHNARQMYYLLNIK